MAVKTIWPITFACGHQAERDLSDRAADRRAGFAEWLAKQSCTDCWRASKEDDEQDKAAWLKAKRAEEQAESEAWSQQYQMPLWKGPSGPLPGVCAVATRSWPLRIPPWSPKAKPARPSGRGSRKALVPSLAPGGGSTSAPPSLTTSPSCSRPPPRPTGRPRTPTSDCPASRCGGAPAPLLRSWAVGSPRASTLVYQRSPAGPNRGICGFSP